MSIFANSEDPDEMLQNVPFHQGLQWLLGQNLERITVHLFEIITCDPTVYPDFYGKYQVYKGIMTVWQVF